MNAIVDFLNNILWGYVLIYGLLAVGVFFTIRLGFIQFRHFGEMVRAILGARQSDKHGISPFQALCTSLASRVGTGNIAGVAVALYLGGAGAIFWMWVVALVGMATGYAESTLAQLYKVRDRKGQYRGGPAFYIAKGLKAPWAGAIFAVSLILSFGLVFNAVQANSIADAMESAFGLPKVSVGLGIAVFAGIVIFGGLRSIVRFAEFVVPFMASAYVLVALYVLAINITDVPAAFMSIIRGAFGLEEAAGGVAGSITAAMLNGIKRGLFSNEAGMGSAPNIAATATPAPHHPSSQGLVQAAGVFIDTIVICTATAIMILLSGMLEPGNGVTGIQLTQQALEMHIGSAGNYFIAIAILFFAFTSIVANYTYAENALIYLGGGNTLGITLLRLVALAMVVWGAKEAVLTVFNAADASMGLMATINLIAIVLLSGTVTKLTKDYFEQRKQGLIPTFKSADYPELDRQLDDDIWK
ncbi:alanine:cation symporter family protein [Pseudomonas sp. G11-1]|uniref:Alanine or glycine:cation symporter, AGCS family n=1 Tax=Halopseudomonas bauzanensis TaxID=653930 RepID=A0A031MKZ5_9GAMM|nr:sodium:alanine symporter family protein [Halopseudomonas bauzanensis]MCO5787739.1 alanine:cation symporter family protein [Pseudomonas sp. G11-1]MCO5790965.1 alanine:cation symporter family protein [Pseudomonas sp. G11-2]EZQ20093.1 sodium:alanine symporter [Halopseudomonas bauzanensis]TKA91437.1 alanine:cation symporter family protein [Halopseudomonas bauzanensis]SES30845.1 alanine or glycine:cation symporter, AGCS family [Halopseudomonas bauzanensis]